MSECNGWPSRAKWNVALWLNGGDESLYRMVRALIDDRSISLDDVARRLVVKLPRKTPDGFRYTFTNVRYALRGSRSKQ